MFRGFGNLLFSKLMKDIYSGDSRGFGFITYDDKASAQKAKDEMNYKDFQGWELKICFKKSMNDLDPDANIFFKNLSVEIKAKQLHELCEEHGKIMSCQIKKDDKGNSLGYAYVQFEKAEDAQVAIEQLNGQEKWGAKLEVQKFISSKHRKIEKKNIYLKNFPSTWNKDKIVEFIDAKFKPLGNVESQEVFEKEIAGEKKYFAFVAYSDKASADEALKLNDIKPEEGCDEALFVGIAESKKKRKEKFKKVTIPLNEQTNLYMKSIKADVTEENIREALSQFGKITSLCL